MLKEQSLCTNNYRPLPWKQYGHLTMDIVATSYRKADIVSRFNSFFAGFIMMHKLC